MRRYRKHPGILLLAATTLFLNCSAEKVVNPTQKPSWGEVTRYHLEVPEPSSLLWDANRGCFWTVSDNTGRVYSISKTGVVLDSLGWEGEDLEAIAIDPIDSTFYVVEERPGVINLLSRSGELITSVQVEGMDLSGNQGIEGISFSSDGERLFVLKEKDPGLLIELDRSFQLVEDSRLRFADDYSDLFCLDSGDTLLVLSDESTSISTILSDGTLIEELTLKSITNPEGFALVDDTLYVVTDETRNLVLFVKK